MMFIYRGCHSTGEALAILCCQTAGGRPNPSREIPEELAPSETTFRRRHGTGDFDCCMKPDNSLKLELAELLQEHRSTVEWTGKLSIAEQFARPKNASIIVVAVVDEARASCLVTESSSGEAGTILWSAEPVHAACYIGSASILENYSKYLTRDKRRGRAVPVIPVIDRLNRALTKAGWEERYV